MRNLVKIFIPLLLLTSCAVQRPATNVTINHKDSLVIHTELVAVPLPVESHTVVSPEKKSHLETSLAKSDASIDSLGMLHHSLENKKDSIKTKIEYVDRIQYRDTTIIKEVPVEVVKEVKTHFWYEKFLWLISIVSIGVLVVKIYLKVKKI